MTDYYGDFTETITCCIENDTFYLDKFIKCADNFNPNIYVFYDGTSLIDSKAQEASESIRTWYQGKINDGFGGRLFEGVIGAPPINGENWLWWSIYPYLGSMTGGTLSDGTEITSFGLNGESVENSEYDSRWCFASSSGKCVPRIASFNLGTNLAGGETGDIYQRIGLGYKLTGPFGENDTRSEGVPFVVTSNMIGENEGVYGNFIGEDKEYICIIVADEADGAVGLYHGRAGDSADVPSDKAFLYNYPFRQYGTGWDNENRISYSNRFEWDYESYLKVWEDIKEQDGSFNGYIYPVDVPANPGRHVFIQHSVAAVEGTTVTESYFEEKYGTEITDVGPQSLNLSALTRTNVYTGFTGTTAYQNLDPSYQNGPGLKNFDWVVDPTVDSFEGGIMGQNIDEFFSGITLSDEFIYTNPIDGLIDNYVYSFSGLSGCYSFDERILSSGEPYSALTVTNVHTSCLLCQPSSQNLPPQPTLCFSDGNVQYEFTPSGYTSGYFVWYNSDESLTLSFNQTSNQWEITPWTNVGLGGMVRQVNETIPTGDFINIGNTRPNGWVMSEGFCDGVPLTVSAQAASETCRGSGNGAVVLLGSGGYEPYQYRIQNVSPYPNYSITGIFSNLTPGNYLGEIIDDSGSTSSTVFTITEGDLVINYNVSITRTVTSSNTNSRTSVYELQVNPSLPSGLTLNFDLHLTHSQTKRDSGLGSFGYNHTITKNGSTSISYTTTTPNTTSVNTTCVRETVEESTTTFDNIATGLTYTSNDTSLVGNVVQTAIIDDASDALCDPQCRMLVKYATYPYIANLTITGDDCSTTSFLGNDGVTLEFELTNCGQT